MDVDEKSFLDQFLILYIIEVQKLPTLRLINFVRVYQSLQQHVFCWNMMFPKHCSRIFLIDFFLNEMIAIQIVILKLRETQKKMTDLK